MKEASIVLSVKNPKKFQPNVGLSTKEKADFPEKLQEGFRDRRWIALEATSEYLNYKYAELMMVGATQDIEGELGDVGEELEEMEEEDKKHLRHVDVDKSVFDELNLAKKENPASPLHGDWA